VEYGNGKPIVKVLGSLDICFLLVGSRIEADTVFKLYTEINAAKYDSNCRNSNSNFTV
jgi:hypothetical protein